MFSVMRQMVHERIASITLKWVFRSLQEQTSEGETVAAASLCNKQILGCAAETHNKEAGDVQGLLLNSDNIPVSINVVL